LRGLEDPHDAQSRSAVGARLLPRANALEKRESVAFSPDCELDFVHLGEVRAIPVSVDDAGLHDRAEEPAIDDSDRTGRPVIKPIITLSRNIPLTE